MSKLVNTDVTSYEFSLKKSFRNNHIRSKYKSKKVLKKFVFFSSLHYSISLKSIGYGSFKFKHFQMVQKFLNHFKLLKRKTYLRVRPYMNSTKKPSETRMGKGKGSFEEKVAPICPGLVILEIKLESVKNTLDEKDFQDWLSRRNAVVSDATIMLNKIKAKLPFKTRIIRNDF